MMIKPTIKISQIMIRFSFSIVGSISRYWYLFKRLTAVSAGRCYRFEHIATNGSGKVVAK